MGNPSAVIGESRLEGVTAVDEDQAQGGGPVPGGHRRFRDDGNDRVVQAESGQSPSCIYRMALASGLFTELSLVKTLGVLRRAGCGEITEIAGQRWKELLP